MAITSPSDISGLVLDLDPHNGAWSNTSGTTAAGVGDGVARVDDQTAGASHVTQGTAASRPTLQEDATGWRYLLFDGTDDGLSNSSFDAGAQPFEAVLVAQLAVEPQFGMMMRSGGHQYIPYYESTNGFYVKFPTRIRGARTDTNRHAVHIAINGVSSDVRVDDVSVLSGNVGTDAWVPGLYVGSNGGVSPYYNGRYYRILIYNRALSPTERSDLNAYLTSLYASAPGGGSGGEVSGSGSLTAPASTASGSGSVEVSGSGNLTSPLATITGAGQVVIHGSGDMTAPSATVSGTGGVTDQITGSGSLAAPGATASGSGTVEVSGSGMIASPTPTASGTGSVTISGSGSLQAPAATLTGSGSATDVRSGSGSLIAPSATLTATGTVLLAGSGTLTAPIATLSGTGTVSGGSGGAFSGYHILFNGTGYIILGKQAA